MVEVGKVEECCDLEDGANLHFLVCLERNKSLVFQGFREFHEKYFNFIFSYSVFLDDGFFVLTID
jgi:hypothetical protein